MPYCSLRLLKLGLSRRAAKGSGWLLPRAVLVGVVASSLWACGTGHHSLGPPRGRNLAAVIKGLDNPFFATMRDGLVAAASEHKLRISIEAAVGLEDTAGQASALESLAAAHAACYVVNPINRTNLIQPLAAVTRGTPIVNIDSPIDGSAAKAEGIGITSYIGTDNVAAGRLAADAMARFVPRASGVAVVTGIPGDAGSGARTQGFMQGIRGRFEVVQTVAADFDRQRARLAAENLLRGRTRIRGFFAVNDEMALGVADAVRALVRTGGVAVIGVDGIAEALDAVKRKALSATVAQYPYTIGQLGVEACLAAIRGKALPARIDAPIQLVTRQNVARAQVTLPRPVERFDDPLIRLLNG